MEVQRSGEWLPKQMVRTSCKTSNDVHWKALTVLDKLHKCDTRIRDKEIAECAKEACKGAAGQLHRLTKPRAVWCPRDAAQGERSTNPRDAADLAVKWWARIWRIHVIGLQEAGRPWEVPDHEEMSELPQLTVEGLAGFAAAVSSFKPKTGIGVDAIHPSM